MAATIPALFDGVSSGVIYDVPISCSFWGRLSEPFQTFQHLGSLTYPLGGGNLPI